MACTNYSVSKTKTVIYVACKQVESEDTVRIVSYKSASILSISADVYIFNYERYGLDAAVADYLSFLSSGLSSFFLRLINPP